MSQNIVEVREQHKFDYENFKNYLDQQSELNQFFKQNGQKNDFIIKQFNHGQSNPTFLINYRETKFVLRKKPPGKILKGAHQIEREFLIQKTLHSQDFPVPKPLHLCNDTKIIGTEFYLMEYVEGRIFVNQNLPELNPDEREIVYDQLMILLAKLHNIDFGKIGLQNYGKIDGNYYDRQIKTWSTQYKASETSQIKSMDYLMDWLQKNIPKEKQYQNTTIVHGDFRLDNVIFHKTELRVLALLDWELSTLGNPLSDLSSFSLIYNSPPNSLMNGLGNFDKDMSGIPTEFIIRDKYLKYTEAQYDISEPAWNFLISFGLFKISAISQGVYKRSLQGSASSTKGPQFHEICKQFSLLGERISNFDYPYRIRPKEYSFINYSDRFREIRKNLIYFMERYIFGKQREISKSLGYGEERFKKIHPMMEQLKKKAKEMGLWNLFLHSESGLSQLEYSQLCEIMGRCMIASEIFNCSAPDTGNMETLHLYGSTKQKEKWLNPLLNGEIRSFFGMTEPQVGSSDATNIQTTIEKTEDGQNYRINGRKWWSSGAGDPRCKIAIIMGVTKNQNKKKHQQHSMILVPLETKGVKINRPLSVFGYDDAPVGHMEVDLVDVIVPIENIILGEGRGFEIAQGRLGPGRIHHCMRLIGMAEKALELMCDRATKRITFGKKLLNHQKIQFDISQSRIEIEQARLLTLKCADMIDKFGTKQARKEIAMIKVVAPKMACNIIDRAIQIYGAAGLSNDTSLANLYQHARTLRLADGPDEVHILTVSKLELQDQFQAKM